MARIRSLRRSDNYLLADLSDALRPRPKRSAFGALWRWRHELAYAFAATVLLTGLVYLVGTALTLVTLGSVGAVSAGWPQGRRTLLARMWWLITPHRLWTGFAQARIQSRRGRLPVVLSARCEPFGERMRVWCPAGTSADDMRATRAILRAACWATDVRIHRDGRYAHLVTVDVIRRGPHLAAAPAGTSDDNDEGPVSGLRSWRDSA